MRADAAPLPVADLEGRPDERPRRGVALRGSPLASTGSRRRASTASSCRTVRSTPSSRSTGSKPVMTIGNAVVRGDRLVLAVAHDRAHVAGPEKALHPIAGRLQHGGDGGRHEHVRHEHREVADAQRASTRDGKRVGGRGRLEADGEEHDLAVGVLLGDAHGVERRVDDPHVGARRTSGAGGRCCEPGTRSMSPNEVKITPGRARDGVGLVDLLERRDAHRAARGRAPARCPPGSRRSMPCLTIECVCPPQTSMSVHGRVVDPGDLAEDLGRHAPVAILVEVLHGSASGTSSSPS